MYIDDVIRLAKSFYPSEYADEEMYVWCNEVSSMLEVEDRTICSETYCSTNHDGILKLPEGLTIENVESVYHNGMQIENQDLRYYGGMVDCGVRDSVIRLVYYEPYIPIRIIRFRGEAVISPEGGYISLSSSEFISGDAIRVEVLADDGSADKVFEQVTVAAVEYVPDDECGCVLRIGQGGLGSGPDISGEVLITRIVTEKTVCAAPYDSMYIDYILAKINLYQHNSEEYNRHMMSFNARLAAYKKWLINHMPSEPGRFRNWWQRVQE